LETAEQTRQHSAALKKELRLGDLVLLQVLLIIGSGWVGTAARQGPTHIVFWLLAIPTFYFPLAYTVIYLSRLMPLEGGVYQWAKLGLTPFGGYMAAWNFSVFIVILQATTGLFLANGVAYALGPAGAWMTSSKPMIVGLHLLSLAAIFYVNLRGFRVGKWITGSAGLLTILVFALLIALLINGIWQGKTAGHQPFALAWPGFSLLGLNLFSKMAFNALGGFDQVAVFAGECRDAGRNIARSVWIAGPLIAALYILGTGAVLVYTSPDQVDLIGPIPQVLGAAFPSGVATLLASVVIASFLVAMLGQTLANIAEVARYPMVAGWDGLLPRWFTRLDTRYRTPRNALASVVLICLLFGIVTIFGVGEQEANQLLLSTAFACSGIYYLILFAIPIAGLRAFPQRPPMLLKIAALSGFCVTLLSIVLQVAPILEVKSPGIFAAKVGITTLLANAAGAFLYARGLKRMSLATGRS
jgi:glutamate:GABA antiporter